MQTSVNNSVILYKGGLMSSLYLVLIIGFFAVTITLIYACEKLRGQS